LIQSLSAELQAKLKGRIMFGTDFSVNLMSIDSYNNFYSLFSSDPSLSSEDKIAFCSVNPERFLFNS